jgi:hypothetical protein
MMRILTILLILMPYHAFAEGARMVLDCAVTTRCDAEARCAPVDESWRMEIAPVETMEDGIGTYGVSWQGKNLLASGESRLGPFLWKQDMVQPRSLTLTSDTTALMVQQNIKSDPQDPDTKIDFLDCKVTF